MAENMGVGSKIDTDADQLRRAPPVLEAYARDLDKHGRPLDSGLPSVLRFVAAQLRSPPTLASPPATAAESDVERAARAMCRYDYESDDLTDVDARVDRDWRDYEGLARAALTPAGQATPGEPFRPGYKCRSHGACVLNGGCIDLDCGHSSQGAPTDE